MFVNNVQPDRASNPGKGPPLETGTLLCYYFLFFPPKGRQIAVNITVFPSRLEYCGLHLFEFVVQCRQYPPSRLNDCSNVFSILTNHKKGLHKAPTCHYTRCGEHTVARGIFYQQKFTLNPAISIPDPKGNHF